MNTEQIEAFDSWWNASKYRQVVYASNADRQIALDGWQAALSTQTCAKSVPETHTRDNDWILAMSEALGTDSRYRIPIMPTPELFKQLFDEVRKRAALSAKSVPFIASKELLAQFNQGRPLACSLDEYWNVSEGELKGQWQDKPHRLLYDLIGAVIYYATPQPPQQADKVRELERLAEVADKERLRLAKVYQSRLDNNESEMNGNMDWARLEGAVSVVQTIKQAIETMKGE